MLVTHVLTALLAALTLPLATRVAAADDPHAHCQAACEVGHIKCQDGLLYVAAKVSLVSSLMPNALDSCKRAQSGCMRACDLLFTKTEEGGKV